MTHPAPETMPELMPDYRYTKKPVTIEAFQMIGDRFINNHDWPQWMHEAWNKNGVEPGSLVRAPHDGMCVVTLEGTMLISVGDWIIRGIKGELYPCKPDIFEATYDRPTPAAPGAVVPEIYSFEICKEGTKEPITVEGETRFIKESDFRAYKASLSGPPARDVPGMTMAEMKLRACLYDGMDKFTPEDARNLLAEIEALQIALSQAPAQSVDGWQPLNTIPPNKKVLLRIPNAYGHGFVKVGIADPAAYDKGIYSIFDDGDALGYLPETFVTGWQDLPATAEASAEDRG